MTNQHNVMNRLAQANEVSYELHTLGWKAFQNLCLTITTDLWGQTVQGFFDSHDGGRDGAFHGTWKAPSGEIFEGAFTIQCKFTAKQDHSLKPSDVADELIKARSLAARGFSDTYILFTNARLTGTQESSLHSVFTEIPNLKHFAAYGCDRITQFIRESPRLRMLVPRVYGLGDLSQIIDERSIKQAKEILNSIGDDLRKFVITDAYKRSADALVNHGFVLLLGEPACGKSTIAAALAMGAIDNWRCSTFKISKASDFTQHSNPDDPNQFFWVDDAFGATQCEYSRILDWNNVILPMNAAIKRGAKILFTSRDYIYKNARQYLKESSIPVMRESQVVIHVENLSTEEREQILYNHVRLGSHPQEYKTKLKPLLPDVALNARFSPEIARRLSDPFFTKNLSLYPRSLSQFVEHPLELLREILSTLDANSRSALALVFMRGGSLLSPISVSPGEQRAIDILGGHIAGVLIALKSLRDSMVVLVSQGGDS